MAYHSKYSGAEVDALLDKIKADDVGSIDSSLSTTSENPVQNKVITEELNKKVDKVEGKQLSTEDFTSELKGKLDGLSNYDDTNLKGDLEVLKGKVDEKQDYIADLDSIRSGASKGSTAIQEHQDISHLLPKSDFETYANKTDSKLTELAQNQTDIVNLKDIIKFSHKTETIQYSLPIVVEPTGQTVSEAINLRNGHKYKITINSDVHNTGYWMVSTLRMDNTGVLIFDQNWDDLFNNPHTVTFSPNSSCKFIQVYIRGVSSVGEITIDIIDEYNDAVITDITKVPIKYGKNLADPELFTNPGYLLGNEPHDLNTIGAGENFITGYIPIGVGESLICNSHASDAGRDSAALFEKMGDLIPIDGTFINHNNSEPRIITNNLDHDVFAVFVVLNGKDVQVEKGTQSTLYEKSSPIDGYLDKPQNYDDYGEIGKYYPTEVAKVVTSIVQNNRGQKLHFVHMSDNHGGGFGYSDEFTDLSPATFLVNTGDMVNDTFNNSFETTQNCILAMNKPGYIVLGNHDNFNAPSLQARFEKYFQPLNTHNGLTGNTKTYYSVDFSAEKVKCIFLDMNDGRDDNRGLNMSYFIHQSLMSDEQINWLEGQLQDAITNDLHVICFIHVSPDYIDEERTPIDFFDSQIEKASGVSFLCNIMDAFIGGSSVTFTHNSIEYTFTFARKGHFIGWICGHMHCDASGWMKNHPKQFSISVPRPYRTTEDGTYRVPQLGVTWNYVTVDTYWKRLSILRMGNNETIWGTPREAFSIIYE